jgi:hypothetical protein
MTDHRVLPPRETLSELLSHDADTGALRWKPRSADWFKSSPGRSAAHAAANWNAIWAGKPALDAAHIAGYREGQLLGQRVLAHRVIWKLVHGSEPPEIDHVNGDPADNRLINLAPVSHAENMKNMKVRTDNKSGVVGVFWKKLENKWAAGIGVDGRNRHLGVFSDLNDAIAARKAAEVAYGFHPNHGLRYD